MLRNALNETIRRALSGNHLLPRDDYAEWVGIVGQVSQQVEEFATHGRRVAQRENLERGANNTRNFQQPISRDRGRYAGRISQGRPYDGQGDVIMGGVNTARLRQPSDNEYGLNQYAQQPAPPNRRSRWKTPDEIRQLRSENRCYRCGRKGCNTRVCRVLPAINPVGNNVRTNAVTLDPIDEGVYEEHEGYYAAGQAEN